MMPMGETSSIHNYGVVNNLTKAQRRNQLFWFSFIVAQIFGVAACIVIGVRAGKYNGGFDVFPNFNYHPFCMTLGFVFSVGQALLTFRLLRGVSKTTLKFVHMSIMVVSLVLMALALHSIISVTNDGMRNVHDWIGLITIVGFVLQFFSGFVTKIYPGASPSVAAWYRPIHNYAGTVIFVLACATAMMGMVMAGQSDFSTAGDLAKVFVICVLIYAIMVVFIIINDQFKRTDGGEQEHERLVGTSFGRVYQSTNHKSHVNTGDGPSKSVNKNELTYKHKTSPLSSLDLSYNEPLPEIKSLSSSDEKECSEKEKHPEESFGEKKTALGKDPITETPSRPKNSPKHKPSEKSRTQGTLLDWFIEA